ncbi:MAG: CDP-diacylglycerol--glycerol-3-phosphate 3-phosphatidyltransferase [Actinomycetota bacterium]|jgi:CDP-diacylglycerol--glycerol-3-phosphate 3-phosphatidyltransferase
MNLPNLITIARIALAPLFIWVLLLYANPAAHERWIAVALFVLASATDGVDGALARKRNQVTDLGKLLDPIADKVLIGGALISLSALGQIEWWITGIILVRELGITIYRLSVIKDRVIAASGGGKLKTILQSVAVGFYLSPLAGYWAPLGIVQQIILHAALISTVFSGLQYLAAARR